MGLDALPNVLKLSELVLPLQPVDYTSGVRLGVAYGPSCPFFKEQQAALAFDFQLVSLSGQAESTQGAYGLLRLVVGKGWKS